jgi:hypothetical protein
MSAPVSLKGGVRHRRLPPRTNRHGERIPKKRFFCRILPPAGVVFNKQPGSDGGRRQWSMQMKRTLIRYKTKPETTEQNQRLIEDVFAELQSKSPEDVRYMVLRLGDGSFLHLVETGEGENPLLGMDAFRRFQSGIRERCIEPPQPSEATVVGNYRMLGEP